MIHFLLTTQRSGSTLTANILNSHSKICGTSPNHMLRLFCHNLSSFYDSDMTLDNDRVKSFFKTFYRIKVGKWQYEADCFDTDIENLDLSKPWDVFSHLYSQEAKANKKPIIVIKEFHMQTYFDHVRQHFPDSKFIFLVRDPRAVALSFQEAATFRGGVVKGVEQWNSEQSAYLNQFVQNPDRFFLIRYEDLITTPEEKLSELCAFLGIDFEPEMLNFYQNPTTKENSSIHEWRNTSKAIDRKKKNRFENDLSKEQILYIEKKCASLMRAFDYAPLYPNEAVDLHSLEKKLIALEPYEKPAYNKISDSEKAMRKTWMQTKGKLESHPITVLRGVLNNDH